MVRSRNNGSKSPTKRELGAARMSACGSSVGVKAPPRKTYATKTVATKNKLAPYTTSMNHTCFVINPPAHEFERRNKKGKVCSQCETNSTPVWRTGPKGPKTLCNACGIKYGKERMKTKKKYEEGNQEEGEEEPLGEEEEALGEGDEEEASTNQSKKSTTGSSSEFEDEKN